MKYSNAIKRLAKLGYAITRDICDSQMHPGTKYEAGLAARKAGHVVEVTLNGGDQDEVATIRVRRETESDELVSDYFCGSWFDTLTKATDYVERCRIRQLQDA